KPARPQVPRGRLQEPERVTQLPRADATRSRPAPGNHRAPAAAGGAGRRGSERGGRPRRYFSAARREAGRSGAGCRSPSQNHWNLAMDIKRVKDYIYWLYYQYLLITCSYALEPWEQSMFHTIMVTVFAMVVYTAYVFVPIHVRLAFEFFSQIFGVQPDSTVSVVN
uniref:Serine palmitoyltransferase small subunit B n=2 Tax=Gallus gallus TaxID=9031 RepID=A0A8V0X189_CHICK